MRMGAGERPNTNRADEVRRRRAQRSQERINAASSRVANPAPTRPVTVRGTTFGTPIHRQAGTRPRRQFYLTMDQAAGTELRLPALPSLHFGWRLVSSMLVLLALLGLYSIYNSPFFQVQAVDIRGLQRLSAEEVNAALKLEGISIIEVDAAAMQQTLAADFPDLIDVRVSVGLPNLVSLAATERTPVIAIQKGDETTWVDAAGVLFPARGDAGPLVTLHTEDDLSAAVAASAPLGEANTGPMSTDKNVNEPDPSAARGEVKMDPTLLAAAQGLSQKIPADTQLIYSKQDGLGWKDAQGWQVFIGNDLERFEEKIEMYQQVAQYLHNQGIRASLVSVENLNAPFYRLEQ